MVKNPIFWIISQIIRIILRMAAGTMAKSGIERKGSYVR